MKFSPRYIKKKLQTARFIITGVEDDLNKAKYNSSGDFLEGEGYGQGEFAFYKEPEYSQEALRTENLNIKCSRCFLGAAELASLKHPRT